MTDMSERTLRMACLTGVVLLSGCATAPLTEADGGLLLHSGLQTSDGVLTRTRQKVDKRSLLAAKSVYLAPTTLGKSAGSSGLKPEQASLVANAIDRALCSGLSRRFTVTANKQSADVSVRVVITHVGATDATVAGTSAVLGIGGKVASAATGAAIPVPRLPFGLGSLSAEGLAISRNGEKIGGLAWARGADFLTTQARASEEGDAYALASAFANDLAHLLVTGNDPISDPSSGIPSFDAAGEYFSGDPKQAECARFGKNPGIGGTLGGVVGLPPSWTDKGANPDRTSP